MENSVGPALAFLSSVTWSLGVTAYSRLSQEYSAYLINASRALWALPLFVALSFLTLGWEGGIAAYAQVTPQNLGWLAGSILASFVIGDALFFLSSHQLGVPGALSIASTFPLWSAFLGWAVRGEQIGALGYLGVLVIVLGTVAVILSGYRKSEVKHSFWVGVGLAVAASWLWSLNTFSIAQGGEGLTTSVVNSVRMASALIFCPLAGWLRTRQRQWVLPRPVLLRYGWLFCLEGFGGSFFFAYGLMHSPLAIGSVLSSLSPVLTALAALFYRRETFSPLTLIGALLVAFGTFLLLM